MAVWGYNHCSVNWETRQTSSATQKLYMTQSIPRITQSVSCDSIKVAQHSSLGGNNSVIVSAWRAVAAVRWQTELEYSLTSWDSREADCSLARMDHHDGWRRCSELLRVNTAQYLPHLAYGSMSVIYRLLHWWVGARSSLQVSHHAQITQWKLKIIICNYHKKLTTLVWKRKCFK